MDEQIETLDLCGLKCPLPALFARRALIRAERGTRMEVVADDPLAAIDLPHMCAQEGFEVLSTARDGDNVRIVLLKP
jgi:tRNA 2-thiouridine synthesizing protein A